MKSLLLLIILIGSAAYGVTAEQLYESDLAYTTHTTTGLART